MGTSVYRSSLYRLQNEHITIRFCDRINYNVTKLIDTIRVAIAILIETICYNEGFCYNKGCNSGLVTMPMRWHGIKKKIIRTLERYWGVHGSSLIMVMLHIKSNIIVCVSICNNFSP